ncbi:MAG: CPBP family intramembrane metalloprotease [Gemmatimonadota bacterium]
MAVFRGVAVVVGLLTLVRSVLRASRGPGFPLFVLLRPWLEAPRAGPLAVGVLAGLASVLLVPLGASLWGAARIHPSASLGLAWGGLAAASLLLKAAFVFFEEVVYRGSLCTELERSTSALVAVVASAALFSLAHAGRSPLGLAILWLDGLGFAAAFLTLGSLWMPLAWHLSKNVAVWALYGGTVELTSGPLRVEVTDSAWFFGSPEGPGVGDLLVTCVVLASVLWYLRRARRSGGQTAGKRSAVPPTSARG